MVLYLVTYLELILVLSYFAESKHCSEKLLDNKNKIPDSAFTESSYKDEFKGKWARESASTEMAWCPNNTIFNLKKDFLMIDLGDLYNLKMIMTKGIGRHGFICASSYIIEYKREANSEWRQYRLNGKEKTIKRNLDHLTESFESLVPSIIARWIKIFPYSEKHEKVCLILQIYGCRYTSQILEYRMIDGEKKKQLGDINYDSMKETTYLSGGLGKLIQNIDLISEDPFDPSNDQLIGWNKPSVQSNQIDIIFRFSDFRNFSLAKVLVSNFFSKNVMMFSRIQFSFSYDGQVYESSQALVYPVKDDVNNQNFRLLTFNLQHNIGLFVKVSLSFRSQWIVVKTFDFISEPCNGDFAFKPLITNGFTRKPFVAFNDHDFFSIPLAYTLVIIVSVLIIMLLIGIPFVTIFIRREKYRNKKCKEALRKHIQEEQARFLTLTTQKFKDSTNNATMFTVSNFHPSLSNINGKMVQESSIYTSLPGSDTDSNCPSDRQPLSTQNINFINTCPITNPLSSKRGSISNDYSAVSFTSSSYIPYYINNSHMTKSQINLRSHYDIVNPTVQNTFFSKGESSPISFPIYGPARLSIEGPLRNSTLFSIKPTKDSSETLQRLVELLHDLTYMNISLDSLKYCKTVRRGQYGSIHIGEWTKFDEQNKNNNIRCQNDMGTLKPNLEGRNIYYPFTDKQILSVKVLSKNVSNRIRKEFCTEIKRLLSLSHKSFPAIWKIEETALGDWVVISEHTPVNDVFNYLQDFNLKDQNGLTDPHYSMTGARHISQSNLIYIAYQVASGMRHLEMLKLVHRDLSCRNLLIMNDDFIVKISDLASANEQFSSNYVLYPHESYVNDFHKSTSCLIQPQSNVIHSCQFNSPSVLPIRWMPWQALLQGKFSSKSDVYSFGATFWELMTLCRNYPYHELTNEQVIINSNLQALGDGQARTLSLPKKSAKEFSDFIKHCMHSNESTRPTFYEIDMFLQQKCVGLNLP